MRPFGTLTPFAEALDRVRQAVVPLAGGDAVERVGLREAGGRVLAEQVRAATAVPDFARAAMDGFAVRAAELDAATEATPIVLLVAAVVYAGSGTPAPLAPNTCQEIATGGMLPAGADTVVPVEHTVEHTAEHDTPPRTATASERADPPESHTPRRVAFSRPPRTGANVTHPGSDIAQGALAGADGTWLTPGALGALAAVGLTHARVYRKPRVAFFTSGDEIVPPGEPLAPGQVYDINSYTIGRLITLSGGAPHIRPNAPDTPEGIARAFSEAESKGADFIVTSGGASVGERDLIPATVARLGNVLLHGVAMKPGKPLLFGRIGRAWVFGLPGYPTSGLTVAHLFLAPALRRAAHLPPLRAATVEATLAEPLTSPAGKRHFLPVRLVPEAGAGYRALNAFKGSGAITSLAEADGYLTIAEETEALAAGTRVRVTRYPG